MRFLKYQQEVQNISVQLTVTNLTEHQNMHNTTLCHGWGG